MKPGIQAAVLLAGFTGMVLAGRGWPDAQTCLACLASLFLAGAGSAMLNGLLDADPDRRMARLQARVAALEKAGKARVLAAALAMIAVSSLLAGRYLDPLVPAIILAAALSYTLLYTFGVKRRTPWGAVIGGIPGALPVLAGYTAIAHSVRLDGMILFIVMLLWQPPHFWALALEYRHDYRAAGIPVLSITHGMRYAELFIFIYISALIPTSLLLWLFGFCSAWYAFTTLISGVSFLAACYCFIIRTDRFAMAFNASIIYLTFLFVAVIGDICFFHGGAP